MSSNVNVNVNDIVRIGKGKVEYRVVKIKMDGVQLESVEKGTKRSEHESRLVIVKSFEQKVKEVFDGTSFVQSFDPTKYTVVVEGEVVTVKRGFFGAADALLKFEGKREVWHMGKVVVQR